MARKAHVKRIYKETKNPDGSVTKDESSWVDMLRIDATTFNFKTVPDGSASRGARYRFNWNDQDAENKAPFRLTEKREVKNVNDESQTLPIWIIDRTHLTHKGGLQPGDGRGGTKQFIEWRFNNSGQSTRKSTAVRVVNNDLGGLDMSKGPVSWDTYLKALKKGSTDDGQAIDVYVVDNFLIRFGADAVPPQTSTKNKLRYGLANKVIENLFKKSPGDAKPVRFDPLQVPVNVGWGGVYIVVTASLGSGYGHWGNSDPSTPCGINFDEEPHPFDNDFDPEKDLPWDPKLELTGDVPGATIEYQRKHTEKLDDIVYYGVTIPCGGGITTEFQYRSSLANYPAEGHPAPANSLGYWTMGPGAGPSASPKLDDCCRYTGDYYTWEQVFKGQAIWGGSSTGAIYKTPAEATAAAQSLYTSGFAGGYSLPEEWPMGFFTEYDTYEVIGAPPRNYVQITSTQKAREWEAVWLIKLPNVPKDTSKPLFTISAEGYAYLINILVYPMSGIKINTGNTVPGPLWKNGMPPNGRTYIPLSFSGKKLPTDPVGNTWPGYHLFNFSGSLPNTNILNAAIWWSEMEPSRSIGTQKYKFVVTSTNHLKYGLPHVDMKSHYGKMIKDRIIEVYLDDSSAGKDNWDGLSTVFWCDKPFGMPFTYKDINIDPDLPMRGPLNKIDIDVPIRPYFGENPIAGYPG